MKKDRYFEFLFSKGFSDDKYRSLALYLHSIPFEWRIDMDKNRMYDGLAMRREFDDERSDPSLYSSLEGNECTMLEFFVGFAWRLVRDMFGDEDISVEELVEVMLTSLDIFYENDEIDQDTDIIISDALNDWIYGEYDDYGHGNIFSFEEKQDHLNEIHMWMQASWWWNENYGY